MSKPTPKEYIVFSQELAGHLMMKHQMLKRLDKTNKDNSGRNIFIFNENAKLLELIDEYKNKQY